MDIFKSERIQIILEEITCLQSLISQKEKQLFKELKMNKRYYDDELAFATAHYQHVLKQFLDYFNTFFKFKANILYYGSCKNNMMVTISSSMDCTALGIEHNAFEDSPIFVAPENTISGCFLTWPGFSEGCQHFSKFHQQRAEQFHVGCELGIQMKHKDNAYEFLAWTLSKSKNDELPLAIQREKILEEYRAKQPAIVALVEQFKTTMHPIVERQSLRRVSLEDLKREQYDVQKHMLSNVDTKSISFSDAGLTILPQKSLSLPAVNLDALTESEKEGLKKLRELVA